MDAYLVLRNEERWIVGQQGEELEPLKCESGYAGAQRLPSPVTYTSKP